MSKGEVLTVIIVEDAKTNEQISGIDMAQIP